MRSQPEESPAERQALVDDVLTSVTHRTQDELINMLSAESGPLVRFGIVEAEHLRQTHADPGHALLMGIALGRTGLQQVEEITTETAAFNPDDELQDIIDSRGEGTETTAA